MTRLEIKSSHKPVKQYYAALEEFEKQGVKKETSVRAAFQELLTTYARKLKWSFTAEYGVLLTNKNKGSVDGVVMDEFTVPMGYWEAKDSDDDFKKEIKRKFEIGYPKSNILFQSPLRAVLYQDGGLVNEYDLTIPDNLVACLLDFFGYKANDQAEWSDVVDQFKERIPENAKQLIAMIEEEKRTNKRFQTAFQTFAELCRASINPNLADAAIEEMLVQHILTARIFETVFDNPEFVRRNVIAAEIERVVDALTSQKFNRKDFYKPLDHFYVALENRAKSITNWSEKQSFLNTVYEKFFQGFAVKVADTHGIVYTPQPIVDFMVRSVQHILKSEFGRSLADEGVHILDPFVGTGNFIMRIMKEIAATQKTKLPKKYASELHCNEVMLLPYYIASMNIEHEYYTQTGDYKPFDGICLVDTFELAEPAQGTLFSTENSERVERQKKSPIFVIIGNPPYNAQQANENDNNKIRKYPVIDKRVLETYSKDSTATLVSKLSDPYVKAYRFASDRIGEEGVVAFVSNNSFIDARAFDGMRKHLLNDFNTLYVVDLKGNVRKDSMRDGIPIGEEHTVFGLSAMVGVTITILVRKKATEDHTLNYADVHFRSTRREKFAWLAAAQDISGLPLTQISPDKKNNWLNEGVSDDWESLIPFAVKAREGVAHPERTLFRSTSNGLLTARDSWAYSFSRSELLTNMGHLVDEYRRELNSSKRGASGSSTRERVLSKPATIKWTRRILRALTNGMPLELDSDHVRRVSYRPFVSEYAYFDKVLNEEVYSQPHYFPLLDSENLLLCSRSPSNPKEFHCLLSPMIPDYHFTGDSSCFPFYTYDEDGSHRTENITDWALGEFRAKVKPARVPGSAASGSKRGSSASAHTEISKWDIFYYVYGLLHHPEYRTKYAANLRRELPRIPISPDFWAISERGMQLADLHVNYETQMEYPLEEEWRAGAGLNLRVEKMKLKKPSTVGTRRWRVPAEGETNIEGNIAPDKGHANGVSLQSIDLIYNSDLTLRGIPAEAFEYRLGNRSAIDWIIDQYQVSTDKRSGIVNDPNRPDDEMYIVNLIRKVVTVSLGTVRIVREIEKLRLE